MPTLRAITSFAVPGQRIVNEGDLVDATDPIVKGREALFESSERVTSRPVEQATAAPGEKRTTRKQAPVAEADSE